MAAFLKLPIRGEFDGEINFRSHDINLRGDHFNLTWFVDQLFINIMLLFYLRLFA
jgi:hypothetical protein